MSQPGKWLLRFLLPRSSRKAAPYLRHIEGLKGPSHPPFRKKPDSVPQSRWKIWKRSHLAELSPATAPTSRPERRVILAPFLTVLVLLICFSGQALAQAPPTHETSATAVGTSDTATVNKPSGTVEGDLLVVGLMFEKGSAVSPTPPAGWTLIGRTNNSEDIGMATYYKVAGASEQVFQSQR